MPTGIFVARSRASVMHSPSPLSLLLVAACASAPPPPPAPTAVALQCAFVAAPELVTADLAAVAAEDHWLWLQCTVTRVPKLIGEALAPAAAAVVRVGGDAPFAAFATRLADVRVVDAATAGALPTDAAPLAATVLPLPALHTAVLTFAPSLPKLLCSRGADGQSAPSLRVAIACGDEQVVLQAPLQQRGSAFACCVGDVDGSALLVQLALAERPVDAPRERWFAADWFARAAAPPPAVDVAAIENRAHSDLLHSLVYVEDRRSALFALANRVDATVCGDFLLTADEASVRRMLTALLPMLPLRADGRFVLDRECLAALIEPLQRGELPPEQYSFLLRQCGAAGRNAATLQAVLQHATDADDLQRQLQLENLDILHESDPAARVHAFDWLRRRGKAPRGFDPLGEREAREQALEAAANAGGTEGK